MIRRLLPLALLGLAACSTAPKKAPSAAPSPARAAASATAPLPGSAAASMSPGCAQAYAPAQEDLGKRGHYQAGGLYAAHIPDTTPDYVPNLDCIAEPMVLDLPRSPVGNRSPYVVLGRNYHVLARTDGYVEQGIASYYGSKFHGRRTSNLEVYDMYAFTAAHKSLPLPSFARVTNLDNGKSVVVRVNDRGPFHDGRVVDLSYAAAVKLDITRRGTGRVEVRALRPGEGTPMLASAPVATRVATGGTTRTATGVATPMDELVGKLPTTVASLGSTGIAASAAQPARPGLAPAPGQGLRYQVIPQQVPSADAFDAWLQARGLRVATGDAGVPSAAVTSSPSVATAGPASGPMPAAGLPAAASVAMAAAPVPAGQVRLQVGSFSSRDNADRALARLDAAGIRQTSLSHVQSQGRTLWRLRVGAADAQSASQLAARIANLGFDQPRVVAD